MRMITRAIVAAAMLMMTSSALPAQTPATNQVMRAKLGHAERVLDALMTSNMTLLERESTSLVVMTTMPGWQVLTSDRYARYSETFRRAAEDLAEFARQRDSDGAMRGYVSMTLACYQCHRYVKDSRLSR